MFQTRKSEFLSGMRDTIPLIIGAIPFGIIFGTLSIKNGLTLGHTMALSMVVFAGSAQFIALGLIASGTSWQIILLTTFVVNLRHLLYSATLAPGVRHLSGPLKAAMAFWLTDETFAVVATRYANGTSPGTLHFYYLGSAILMYVNWALCTLTGAMFGNLIPGAAEWGLDFAMPVTFIGMLVPYLRNLPMISASAVAGMVALLSYGLPNKIGLVLAAGAGIAAGYGMDLLLGRRGGMDRGSLV